MIENYILKNQYLEVHLSSLGATISKMYVFDKVGRKVDVVLGLERAEDYGSPAYIATGAYLGAGVGRYANRIARGEFSIDGKMYQLNVNNGVNHLHGGNSGFSHKEWSLVRQNSTLLELQYISPDGEENYPGTLTVNVLFELKERELWIGYRAKTDKKCFVNLTHHPTHLLIQDILSRNRSSQHAIYLAYSYILDKTILLLFYHRLLFYMSKNSLDRSTILFFYFY
jgi:aldose 1-epimerase